MVSAAQDPDLIIRMGSVLLSLIWMELLNRAMYAVAQYTYMLRPWRDSLIVLRSPGTSLAWKILWFIARVVR